MESVGQQIALIATLLVLTRSIYAVVVQMEHAIRVGVLANILVVTDEINVPMR